MTTGSRFLSVAHIRSFDWFCSIRSHFDMRLLGFVFSNRILHGSVYCLMNGNSGLSDGIQFDFICNGSEWWFWLLWKWRVNFPHGMESLNVLMTSFYRWRSDGESSGKNLRSGVSTWRQGFGMFGFDVRLKTCNDSDNCKHFNEWDHLGTGLSI